MNSGRLLLSVSKDFLRFRTARYLFYNLKKCSRYFMLPSADRISFHLKRIPWIYSRVLSSKYSLRNKAVYLAIIYISCGTSMGNKFTEAAISENSDEIKRLIADGGDINSRHTFGWTALHIAAVSKSLEFVEQLLELGANPDLGDKYTNMIDMGDKFGIHPMHAVKTRELHFTTIFNRTATFSDCTALHYAVLADREDVTESLLQHGANPLLKNARGETAFSYAESKSMKLLLQKYTKKYLEKQEELRAEERRKYPLEQSLKQFIVGQEGAIANVAAAIRRRENNWYYEDRPLVLLFMGSSGIGKTELAKQVANYLHKNSKNGFIRLDMTEYQHKHEVSKLIGSPPGYVGYDDGGTLTKKLKAFPNAVVLFDEVEKAHPDVLTVLLQLFDEGRLTDGKGQTVECKNAVFIMTTNLASDEIGEHAQLLREEAEKFAEQHYSSGKEATVEKINISKNFKDKVVYPILKKSFQRNEFLGRINEIVYFLPFSKQELLELVERELEHWAIVAKTRHKITLTWDPSLIEVLSSGYDVHYGARSLKNEVERRVISLIASADEKKIFTKGSRVFIGVSGKNNDSKEGKGPSINLIVGEGENKHSYFPENE